MPRKNSGSTYSGVVGLAKKVRDRAVEAQLEEQVGHPAEDDLERRRQLQPRLVHALRLGGLALEAGDAGPEFVVLGAQAGGGRGLVHGAARTIAEPRAGTCPPLRSTLAQGHQAAQPAPRQAARPD
ncbi:hypothetical protein OV079_28575 [Nannocystis pusilla]|uniref:Uncharacterized protein n=1 Tax=Nannocystis pusilla TaxID=889268 RepID=A0A9X3J099_9BACT|nr:hypothetical protein [Nannocystis pusilla]MCY1009449.1 hypothetical protein [Nannocystis pusilla]